VSIPEFYRRPRRRQRSPPPSTRIETRFRDFTLEKRFLQNRILPPDLYSSSATTAKPPPEHKITPPPRERRFWRDFTRDPNLQNATSRIASKESMVSDTTLSGPRWGFHNRQQFTNDSYRKSRELGILARVRDPIYWSLYIVCVCNSNSDWMMMRGYSPAPIYKRMTAHAVTLVYDSKSNNGDNFTQVVGAVDLTHRCVDGWMGLTVERSNAWWLQLSIRWRRGSRLRVPLRWRLRRLALGHPQASPSDSASSGYSATGFGEEQKSRGVLKSAVGMG
jgi:hypothetical protein